MGGWGTIAVVALFRVYAQAPEGSSRPELSWFNPFAIESFSGFSQAILLAVFIPARIILMPPSRPRPRAG